MSDKKQILLRLDKRIHDALKRWADDELRSLNAQIEYLLREQLRVSGRMKEDGVQRKSSA
jgi:hypothetical protein